MAKPPVTLAQLAKDLDHIETALGDIMHNQDKQNRCLRIILKLCKHIHGRKRGSKKL